MTRHVGFSIRNQSVDPLPDCPDHRPGAVVRIWGHPPEGREPPFTPWCTECGWRGDEVTPTETVPAVDIRSLDGVPKNVLTGGTPIHPAYLNQLPSEKVSRARPEDDPAQTDRIAKVLHDDN